VPSGRICMQASGNAGVPMTTATAREITKRRAVFFDRDGVINAVVIRDGKVTSPRSLREYMIVPDVRECMRRLKETQFLIIVITNQPEVSRGLLRQEKLDEIHGHLSKELPVDAIYCCLHDDHHACACRKPKPGMILDAANRWHIDLKQSFVVGDTEKDMQAARAAGCASILIEAEYNAGSNSTLRVKNISEAVEYILNSDGGGDA